MNRKKNLLIVVLVVLLNLAWTASAGAGQEIGAPACTNLPQAGKMTVLANGPAAWTVIQFAVEFCEPPIVVASPGENTANIQIGVVTPSVAWVLAGVARGEAAVIYWQAIPATQ